MKPLIKGIGAALEFISSLFLMGLLVFNGCASSSLRREKTWERDLSKPEFSQMKEEEEFRIGVQSKLLISVEGESDLTRQVTVRSDGAIHYAYLGKIVVQGLTPFEMERELTRRLSMYVKFPRVTVKVLEFGIVYVLGKAKNPGMIKFETQPTALQVLAAAGGFDNEATRSNLQVIRNIRGKKRVFKIALKEVEGGGIELIPLLLLPGDTVVVE